MTTSCKDVMQLRNSARKTKSQMRMVDRSLNRTKKHSEINKTEGKIPEALHEETSELVTEIHSGEYNDRED